MVPLCIPDSEEHLAVIRSLLEMADIAYIVRNEHFGAMVPGAIFAACGPREVLVSADCLEQARRLLTPPARGRTGSRQIRSSRSEGKRGRRSHLRSV